MSAPRVIARRILKSIELIVRRIPQGLGSIVMRAALFLPLSGLLLIVTQVAAIAGCPLHSSPRYETGNVVHCRCNPGYENRNGTCRPIAVMRAMTRADCVRFAGERLRQGLAKCRSPLVRCLESAGVRKEEAYCVASALASALVATAVPSTAAVFAPAVVACGRDVEDAAKKCSTNWGACEEGSLRAHKAAVAACPRR